VNDGCDHSDKGQREDYELAHGPSFAKEYELPTYKLPTLYMVVFAESYVLATGSSDHNAKNLSIV